ncbi:carboxypeptidase-like regulatory domain-containing protein [Flavobacterium hauense]
MIKNLLICFVTLLGVQIVNAQNITGKIVDAENGQSLPNAGVVINDTENIIGSEEGFFTLPEKTTDDVMLAVSFLGYKTAYITVSELKKNNVIKLQPGAFELETVYVTNIKVNADSIMAAVKSNLKHNYRVTEQAEKNMIFYREGMALKPVKLQAKMTKATGYDKKQLNDANIEIKAFASELISHPPQQFTDMLCNYHTAMKTYQDKPVRVAKFEVVKAVELKDRSRSVDLDEMEKMASGILFKHLDAHKLYRIKSGLLGTRDTVVANGAFYESKKFVTTKSKLGDAKSKVMSFMGKSNLQSSNFDFINKQELYEYTYAGTTQSGGNESVFIIKFKPKKRKSKYAGTLYVSEKDYAVVRAEYVLGEGKTLGGVNLKFLFGVKQSENISKGTLIYKEKADGKGYYLQYGSIETGEYVYVNRPLKFLEIGEGDKHEVAFDLKIEVNEIERKEYFVISKEESTVANYDQVKESEFDYIKLSKYDPAIWKEYSAIEPLQEMKQFRTLEE